MAGETTVDEARKPSSESPEGSRQYALSLPNGGEGRDPRVIAELAALALPPAETPPAGGQQAQLRAIASDLLYWKGGLTVLRQAQLPKWRGYFKWQIEAQIESLQTEYATLRTEAAKPDA